MRTVTRRRALAIIGAGVAAPLWASCGSGGVETDQTAASTGPRPGRGPLHYMSLRDVATLIAARELSSVDLTQMMLDRIAAVDGRLRSYATVMGEQAMAAASAADAEIAAGAYRGPLHGVPVAVKDLCYTQGVQTMGGLPPRLRHPRKSVGPRAVARRLVERVGCGDGRRTVFRLSGL